jgi:hypothetical protein
MPAAEGSRGIFRAGQEPDAADAGCIGKSGDAPSAQKPSETDPRCSQTVSEAMRVPGIPTRKLPKNSKKKARSKFDSDLLKAISIQGCQPDSMVAKNFSIASDFSPSIPLII